MIKPTPGRIVLYYPSAEDRHGGMAQLGDAPLAAIVAGVYNDRCVNLAISDAVGWQYARQNVQLLQGDDQDVPVEDRAHAAWMPYQKEQAERKEASRVEAAPAPSHQDRVRAERAELNEKIVKLGTEVWATLPVAERERLRRQRTAMREYLDILDERIAAF